MPINNLEQPHAVVPKLKSFSLFTASHVKMEKWICETQQQHAVNIYDFILQNNF